MAEETEENKINLNLDFESIVPWNGQQDTGKDVRLKLDRNWQKVVEVAQELQATQVLEIQMAHLVLMPLKNLILVLT